MSVFVMMQPTAAATAAGSFLLSPLPVQQPHSRSSSQNQPHDSHSNSSSPTSFTRLMATHANIRLSVSPPGSDSHGASSATGDTEPMPVHSHGSDSLSFASDLHTLADQMLADNYFALHAPAIGFPYPAIQQQLQSMAASQHDPMMTVEPLSQSHINGISLSPSVKMEQSSSAASSNNSSSVSGVNDSGNGDCGFVSQSSGSGLSSSPDFTGSNSGASHSYQPLVTPSLPTIRGSHHHDLPFAPSMPLSNSLSLGVGIHPQSRGVTNANIVGQSQYHHQSSNGRNYQHSSNTLPPIHNYSLVLPTTVRPSNRNGISVNHNHRTTIPAVHTYHLLGHNEPIPAKSVHQSLSVPEARRAFSMASTSSGSSPSSGIIQSRVSHSSVPFKPYDPSPTGNSTKLKRFFCDSCGKGFTQKGGLINHTRIHRGERPYVCSFQGCGRAFVQKCNLTRHERVHTGEKPYQCPVDHCHKQFNRKHGLTQHLLLAHEIQQQHINSGNSVGMHRAGSNGGASYHMSSASEAIVPARILLTAGGDDDHSEADSTTESLTKRQRGDSP